MKRVKFTLLALIISRFIFSQVVNLNFEKYLLDINYNTSSYSLYKNVGLNDKKYILGSEGKIKIDRQNVICEDKKNNIKISLRKVNNYCYTNIKNNCYFKSGVKLFAFSYISKDEKFIVKQMFWRKEKEHGNWLYLDYKKNKVYFVKYYQGQAVDTIYINSSENINRTMYQMW